MRTVFRNVFNLFIVVNVIVVVASFLFVKLIGIDEANVGSNVLRICFNFSGLPNPIN